ncbi:MAG: NAD-dependent epimerase/dehydratase family protein [Nitrospiraceae bacterium]|nr:NAD-dependent epimerase/dehydratase family protein [Nitrospiraceae bacterium]
MKILITGNMGYIGPVLIEYLRNVYNNEVKILGYDSAFFGHCLTNAKSIPEHRVDIQYFGDLRKFPESILAGVDTVIHLAAISNDPMGNRFEKVTTEINSDASAEFARKAKKAGVRNFVFASSCSMYGSAEGGPRKESDKLNPLTAYAKSKVFMERELELLADENFITTCLRFSTACGMSDRLRLDLVLNDFVASAVSIGKIVVLSDGTPWRPLIHVKDMARAIDWAMNRAVEKGGNFLQINIGSDVWTYQIGDLAKAVADIIPNTEVSINKNAQPDKRSYKVDFSLFKELAPDSQPILTLEDAVMELKHGLEEMQFNNKGFRDSWFMRLKVLESHIEKGILTRELYWIK